MPITMHGRWRLLVTEAIHNWTNRFVIEGATSGNGVYPPTVGTVAEADGLPSWTLRGEYENPAEPGVWQASEMQVLSKTITGAEIRWQIGSEDPLPQRDFEDIQWQADFIGRMFDVPYRPYAVRMQDLFEMPDGVFDTLLGTYYMGVRVRNTWGETFGADNVIDVSPTGRATLAANGIQIIDAWSQQELAYLGQAQLGTGMSLAGLAPGSSRTVFFKVDVSAAAPRKYEVEFMHVDMSSTPDPHNPKRRLAKQIFVSSSYLDEATGDMVCEADEGTLRLSLRAVAYDRNGFRKSRKRGGCKPTKRRRQSVRDLGEKLRRIGAGRIDPCELLKLIQCHCECGDRRPPFDPQHPCDDKYTYGPFYMVPTKFAYTIQPRHPFGGQYGPIPYEDPWWKVLLLILAIILLIAGALSEGANSAYHDEDLVIGTLDRSEQNDVDAAVCRLNTSRVLRMLEVSDALTGEPNTRTVTALDGVVALTGPVITRAEIDGFLAANDLPNLRVFKSGARTGMTFGIITSTTSDGHDEATWDNRGQLNIDPDPAFPNSTPVADKGDSGSVWIHSATNRPVGLEHTVASDTTTDDFARASFLEDVQEFLEITI